MNQTKLHEDYEEENEGEQLSRSLTSMDWLQRLNADYVTRSSNVKEDLEKVGVEPDSSTEIQTEQIRRPPYSFKYLIQWALQSAPRASASSQQVCAWIEAHFPYYKSVDPTWKVAIEETLIANPFFSRFYNLHENEWYWTFTHHQNRPEAPWAQQEFTVIRRKSDIEAEMCLVNPHDIFRDPQASGSFQVTSRDLSSTELPKEINFDLLDDDLNLQALL